MKKLTCFIFSLFLFLMTFCQADTAKAWFSIKAFIPQWKGATAELIVDGETVSRQTVSGDVFSYNSTLTMPHIAVLHFQKRNGSLFVPLFIEPGLIRIRIQTQFNLIPYGTPTNDAYATLTRRWDSVLLSLKVLSPQESREQRRQLATAFIRQQPASLISLKLLDDLFYLDPAASDTLYHALFQSLPKALKATATGRKLNEEVAARFATAVGKPAPQLSLPGLTKKPEPLYLTGGLTLLNFWASWCAPCRKEHPALKRLMAEYGTKGFSIVSISLDTAPALWQKAVRQEALAWRQLGDGRGWESPAAKEYGIKAIPANFLLDANGVIIGKNLSLDSLEKRLEVLLR